MGSLKRQLVDRSPGLLAQPAGMVTAVPVALNGEPARPRHTCKHDLGFTAVVQTEITHVSPWQANDYHNCPACLYRRAQRAMNQLKHERQNETVYALELDPATWKKIKERFKKRTGSSYCAFPLESGNFGVLHNQPKEGGDNLDLNLYADTFALLQSWVNTAEGQRVQPSQGWGGPWAGFQGNTAAKQEREAAQQTAEENGETLPPQVTVKGKASPVAVARHFGVELKRGRRCTIVATWYTVYTGLLEVAGKGLETLDGQAVLPALLNAFVEFSKEQDTAEKAEPAAEQPATLSPAEQPGLWPVSREGHEGVKSKPAPIYLPNWLGKGVSYVGTS